LADYSTIFAPVVVSDYDLQATGCPAPFFAAAMCRTLLKLQQNSNQRNQTSAELGSTASGATSSDSSSPASSQEYVATAKQVAGCFQQSSLQVLSGILRSHIADPAVFCAVVESGAIPEMFSAALQLTNRESALLLSEALLNGIRAHMLGPGSSEGVGAAVMLDAWQQVRHTYVCCIFAYDCRFCPGI
jgi:hypothetical protein